MSHPLNPYPEEDMEFILGKSSHHFKKLDGASILLTGGTGFVGSWILQFLMYASNNLRIDINLDVVTRKSILIPSRNFSNVRFIQHDMRLPIDFDDKDYSHAIFASTPSNPTTGGLNRNLVLDSTILGTKNLVEFLQRRDKEVRYLNTSSGAVKKVRKLPLSEGLDINDIYAMAKSEAEKFLMEAAANTRMNICSPRLYSFAGPGIATNAHFAIGNFIRDAIEGRDVVIKGNPETVRSYLHPIDMTIQLLDCLLGENTSIFPDIGSFNPIKIFDLAKLISESVGNGNVVIIDNSQLPTSYTPDFLTSSLNHQHISLEETITRWRTWLLLT